MLDYTQWLSHWFKQRAPHIQLDPNDNYFNAGAIDSLGIIELIEAIEQTFSVQFSGNDFQDRRFSTVAGLAALLAEKQVR